MYKLKNEIKHWQNGINVIAGVDEVGRGSYAGPLVSASVAWSSKITTKEFQNTNPEIYEQLQEINDSKKLTEKKRNRLSDFIRKNCLAFSIVVISSKEIDQVGVGEANKIALVKAGLNINDVECVLVDHFDLQKFYVKTLIRNSQNQSISPNNSNELSKKQKIQFINIPKGDENSISIASASIIAKVYRDNLMKNKYHELFPKYGFDTNVGYGTKKHREAIEGFGLCEIHRKSFSI